MKTHKQLEDSHTAVLSFKLSYAYKVYTREWIATELYYFSSHVVSMVSVSYETS